MESCLTLVKQTNSKKEKELRANLDSHPEPNKKNLLNKYMVAIQKQCIENISQTQIDTLQAYKNVPEDFELYNQEEYAKLVAFDLNTFTAPATVTDSETVFIFEIEEIGEKLKTEASEKQAKELGQTTLAFLDLQSMSKVTQLLYFAAVFTILGLIFSVIFKAVQPEPDF